MIAIDNNTGVSTCNACGRIYFYGMDRIVMFGSTGTSVNLCEDCMKELTNLLNEKLGEVNPYNSLKVFVDEREGAKSPTRAHSEDAGLDIYSPGEYTVPAHGSAIIDTGVHVAIPSGYAGFLKSKSGLNVKHGITSEGVIDVGYTGSIVVKLYNHSDEEYKVEAGDKISQLVLVRIGMHKPNLFERLESTERGDNGFGSTGRK